MSKSAELKYRYDLPREVQEVKVITENSDAKKKIESLCDNPKFLDAVMKIKGSRIVEIKGDEVSINGKKIELEQG